MNPIEIINELKKNKIIILKEEKDLHGILLKLSSKEMIKFEIKEENKYILTKEGEEILKTNSPEYILYCKSKEREIKTIECNKQILGNAIKQNLIKLNNNKLIPIINKEDIIKEELNNINNNKKEINELLLKRKLIKKIKEKTYKIFKGINFNLSLNSELITNINLQNIFLKDLSLKKYNFNTKGVLKQFGSLHPLLKLKEEFKNIFIEMGFQEMNTNLFIESSFWNFDALFQPQLHPSREMHDTFFIKNNNENYGEKTLIIPNNYLKRVESAHLGNNYNTKGYKTFNKEECYKNVLRTHTTATSTRYLYNLSKENNNSIYRKYFSIDKVFRNESVDATHLAEFHQIEGLVIGEYLNISHLKGILTEFFKKVGLNKIKFKPAYNPYTEPSMEVFAFHEELNIWMEVGNSGIFRPEMLEPMGFESNIKVIAWGLSLERPAMIKFGKKNIRDLMGHKVDLNFIKETGFVSFI